LSSFYYLARSGITLSRWIPQCTRHTLGSSISVATYLSWSSKRLVTQLNMAQVTGRSVHDPYVRHLAFASWRNYGRYAADFINFPHLDISAIDRNLLDLTQGANNWIEHIEHALETGRGAIITSAHFGNWDIAAAILAYRLQASAVVETVGDAQLNQLLQDQRKEKGLGLIPMEGSARRILRALQQNQAVAIAIDRPVKQDEGTAVTFFGRKTYVPSGAAALALKSGAPIIPGYVWYSHRKQFYIRTFPPIIPQESKGEERTKEIARITQRIIDSLEEIVREWPTQWYMFRQFWPAE
jgi:lauroyl/myristoyl acyltransferase